MRHETSASDKLRFAPRSDEQANLRYQDSLELKRTQLDSVQHASQPWDLIVIGAGPSGSFAAREASRLGAKVLLVDRAEFPRRKVCGCCLNSAGLRLLADAGLGDLPQQMGAPSVDNFRVASHGRVARLPIHAGVAISRERLDTALIKAATAEGATFLERTSALICGHKSKSNEKQATREVRLKSHSAGQSPELADKELADKESVSRELVVSAQAVVVAGGLGCRAFEHADQEERAIVKRSRIGGGTTLPAETADFAVGTISMACHRSGYVGLVRLEDGRLDVAAAFDQQAIKTSGGMGELAAQVVSQAGLPVPAGLAEANWHGTPRLTQSRQQVAGHRYFVIGDAAGYVEPFTGEGMTWALASGRAVVPFVMQTIAGGGPQAVAWQRARRRVLRKRARACRTLSLLLRHPTLVRSAVRLLSWQPRLAQPFVHSLDRPYVLSER